MILDYIENLNCFFKRSLCLPHFLSGGVPLGEGEPTYIQGRHIYSGNWENAVSTCGIGIFDSESLPASLVFPINIYFFKGSRNFI